MSKKLTGITVTTELGVVSLSGSVATETIRQQATQIAAAIDGVRGVEYAGLSVKMPS
jgi:osmotically-inducible protein OsmY